MMVEDGESFDPMMANNMVVTALRRLLSDAVTMYLRAQGFHWNVKGSGFSQYHELFGQIYQDVYESVDPTAENILKLGGIAPFRLPELMAMRSITDNPVPSMLPADLVADLLSANDSILMTLNMTFHAANSANQQGIANFVSERIDQHQRWDWQLKSSLAM